MTQYTNRLLFGDCMTELDKIHDNSCSLLLTDVPYGINKTLNCKGERLGTTAKLDFEFGNWDSVSFDWCEKALKKTKGWVIIFCAKRNIGDYWDILEKNGFIGVDSLVWQKPDPLPLNGKTKFLNAWESAVIGKRNGAVFNGYCTHNIFKYQAPKGKDRFHPTQKPLKLFQELIRLTTNKDDVVLDPFAGIGTTALACLNESRNYICIEKEQKYFEKMKALLEKKCQGLNCKNGYFDDGFGNVNKCDRCRGSGIEPEIEVLV